MNERFVEMGKGFIDVHKQINKTTLFFVGAIGSIAIILKILDIIFV